MISEADLEAFRNHAHNLPDQSTQWALGQLLEFIMDVDSRVDALEREAGRLGVDQAVMSHMRRCRLYPDSDEVRGGLVDAMRAAVDDAHRTPEQLSILTGLPTIEIEQLLDA